MNRMMMAIMGSRTLTTSGPHTSNFSWPCPATTTSLESAIGVGAAGAPAVAAAYTAASVIASSMDYEHDVSPVLTSAGALTWFNFNSQVDSVKAAIDAAAAGTSAATYTRYSANVNKTAGGSYSYDESYVGGQSTVNGNIRAGSTFLSSSGGGGSSGSQVTGVASYTAYYFVNYEYLTPGTGLAATTGTSSTIVALSLTFPGGTGGAGSNTSYFNVPVTPSTSYPIVVPAGGSVTLTYYV